MAVVAFWKLELTIDDVNNPDLIMIMRLTTWSVASFEQSRCTSCCGACLPQIDKHSTLIWINGWTLYFKLILGEGLVEVEGELGEESSFQFSQPKIQVWLNPAWNIKCFSDCYNFTTQPDSTKSYFPNDLDVVWVFGLGLNQPKHYGFVDSAVKYKGV